MSKKHSGIPEHILDVIKVTPEETEEFRKRTVGYTVIPFPNGEKKPKGKIWCCYCGSFEKFTSKREDDGSYSKCEKCKVSINDFHIRKENKLFGNSKKKKDDK